jgi:transposase
MATSTKQIRLRRGDRRVLESWARSRTLSRRQVERAKIVLAAAGGESSRSIAAELGIARDTARLWLRRYESEGLEGLEDRPRSGRPREVTPEVEAEIIEKTVEEAPPAEVATHWSSRLLGEAMDLHHLTIWRVWQKYGLKPHQIRRFKLSRDPRLIEKLHDVIGIYLNPPENAVVFSFDEKSQIQALDRTQPGLPLKKGRAGTMTHDYKRHGTTTLFAALDVATGRVHHECMPRHRHQEFLKFMKQVEKSVEPGLDIHVILDNYATHKHEKVRRWLKRNPRVHFHFIPTGASWLNLVERLFSELQQRKLKRLAVNAVPELIHHIDLYLDHRNEDPKPFIWTKSAEEIIAKIDRGLKTLEALHYILIGWPCLRSDPILQLTLDLGPTISGHISQTSLSVALEIGIRKRQVGASPAYDSFQLAREIEHPELVNVTRSDVHSSIGHGMHQSMSIGMRARPSGERHVLRGRERTVLCEDTSLFVMQSYWWPDPIVSFNPLQLT